MKVCNKDDFLLSLFIDVSQAVSYTVCYSATESDDQAIMADETSGRLGVHLQKRIRLE